MPEDARKARGDCVSDCNREAPCAADTKAMVATGTKLPVNAANSTSKLDAERGYAKAAAE